jgi:hypothetical protein
MHFFFYKTANINEEVNYTETFSSVRIPCTSLFRHAVGKKVLQHFHQIGLDEVRQLRENMTSLAVKLGFKNLSFKEFTHQGPIA